MRFFSQEIGYKKVMQLPYLCQKFFISSKNHVFLIEKNSIYSSK